MIFDSLLSKYYRILLLKLKTSMQSANHTLVSYLNLISVLVYIVLLASSKLSKGPNYNPCAKNELPLITMTRKDSLHSMDILL